MSSCCCARCATQPWRSGPSRRIDAQNSGASKGAALLPGLASGLLQVTVRVEGSGAACEAQLPSFVVPVGFSCGDRVCGLFNDLILDGNADGAFELVEGDLVAVWLALVVDCVHLPMIPPPRALNNGAHDGPEMLAQRAR